MLFGKIIIAEKGIIAILRMRKGQYDGNCEQAN